MISAETVTQVWQQMAQQSVRQAPRLVEQMKEEQPAILAYLLALEALPFSAHEHRLVFYLGMVVWQIMKLSDRRLRKVTRRKLDQADMANQGFLELLASDTDADFVSATQTMLENYPEPEVLRYIIAAFMEEEDYALNDLPIRDEYRGLAFVHLKTMLDALINSLAA